MNKYFGMFDDYENCKKEWHKSRFDWAAKEYTYDTIESFPTDEEILFANYGSWSYDGDGYVLFRRDGKLYENFGSHCSCYGLEGQWEPSEVTVEELKMRKLDTYYYDQAAIDFYRELVNNL